MNTGRGGPATLSPGARLEPSPRKVGAPTRLPRLVASDLDGTLLTSAGDVSARTAQVWSSLPARGVETVVVTARPPRWLHHLADVVASGVAVRDGADGGSRAAHSIAICGNGAFVYDVAARRIIEADGFSALEASGLVADLCRHFPGAGAAFETDRGMFRTPAYPDPHREVAGPTGPEGLPRDAGGARPGRDGGGAAVASAGAASAGVTDDVTAGVVDCDVADLPRDLVVGKILLRDARWRDDGFVTDVSAALGSRGVLAYSGAAGLAEISAPGVTKAWRLASWCGERGVESGDVWAFGDMPNDLPMLAWAGHGVAVANAHTDVLAAADDVCASNDDDGVSRYLQAHLATDRA